MDSTAVRNDLKVDTLFRDYFADHGHFSDMVNATLFNGQQIVYPHMVSEYDSSVSTYFEDTRYKTLERERDSLKKITIGHQAILIGIENQGQEIWNMPFRIVQYNALTQFRQWNLLHNGKERMMNMPVKSISLVLYYGEKRWNGPRTYDEAIHPVPTAFEDIAKYNMHPITDIVALDYHLFKNQDNRDMVKGLQMLYKWKGDLEVFKGMKMKKIVALIIAAHANNEELLRIILHDEREENVDMCESMRLYTERITAESEKRGEKKGEKKGERNGLINTLIDQLKLKMGQLSPEIVVQIKASEMEQLNQLKMKIFNIESEKDIRQIISHK